MMLGADAGLQNSLHAAYTYKCRCLLWCEQVSVQLPTSEVETSEQKECFAPAMHWADVFWNVCLQR